MKILNKISSILLLAFLFQTLFSFANEPLRGKYKKTKEIVKEYVVSTDNTLHIENEFGNVNITTWDKNVIRIEVHISVESKDEDKAQDKLEDVEIIFSQSGSFVKAETIIAPDKGWGLNLFGNKINVDLQIDYTVKMPLANNLDVDNDYGTISIDKLEGDCIIHCEYGGIDIGELYSKYNQINMDYCNHSRIDYVNQAKIKSDYSRLHIEKSNNLDLTTNYTDIEINEVGTVVYNSDYGSLKIQKVSEIEGNSDFLVLKIKELDETLNINCNYGSIKVYSLNKNFSKLEIDSDYTSIKIGVPYDTSFDFITTTEYAKTSFEDVDADYKREKDDFTKKYTGTINSGSNQSTVTIDSEYGNVKFYIAK